MYSGGEFRTAIFGGYNKEDVRSYMEQTEKDAELAKFEYQREIVSLKSKLQKAQEEKRALEERMQGYSPESDLDLERTYTDDMDYSAGMDDLDEQRRENEALRQRIRELEAEKLSLTEAGLQMEHEIQGLKGSGVPSQSNVQMEQEILQLQEKKEKYEADLAAITKVFEDARLNAQHIQEEAQLQAREIIARAEKESRELIERRKVEIDKELEDKGIRLMAARYKIETYRNEINSTQQKLYNLYADMGKLVEGMPQRLEQLWEDEGRFNALEKKDSGRK